MSKSNSSSSSRRQFLGSTVALGAAAVVLSNDTQAQNPPKKFTGLDPMWPAKSGGSRAPVADPPLAVRVLNKAGFGPRPGDVEAYMALASDPTGEAQLPVWVDNQLNPALADPGVDDRLQALKDSELQTDKDAYDTIDKTDLELWTDYALNEDYSIRNRPVWQMERLTLLRGAYSEWQLREVLFDFWFNHFNIFGREFPAYGMMPSYDRVLRQHIFGNFGDMLKAIARTSSMLYYLDNYVNTWPYPNENYAREVLELHTLGAVENYYGSVDPTSLEDNDYDQRTGYTEIDVFEFAKALTGWGVSDGQYESPETGEFLFRPDRHYDDWEEAPIQVMDAPALTGPGGESDVTDILDYLAGHYGTARHVSWKLCTRLIGDNPPDSIVNTAALEFYNRRNEGSQLKEVYRTILTSPEFKSVWGNKVKRPIETLIRAMRGADVDFTIRVDESVSNSVFGRLDDTGQYPFGYAAPTGYPDESVMWTGSGPLIMSWRTVTYMLRRGEVVNFAEQTNGGISDPDLRTPVNIVDFWMNRALGYAMDASVTAKLVEFVVNTAGVAEGEPVPSHPMSSIYKKILRGLVGLTLMSPDSMKR